MTVSRIGYKKIDTITEDVAVEHWGICKM